MGQRGEGRACQRLCLRIHVLLAGLHVCVLMRVRNLSLSASLVDTVRAGFTPCGRLRASPAQSKRRESTTARRATTLQPVTTHLLFEAVQLQCQQLPQLEGRVRDIKLDLGVAVRGELARAVGWMVQGLAG
jgi:hypothetical protein